MKKIILLFSLGISIFLAPWIYLHSKYDRGVLRSLEKNTDKNFPEVALVLGAGLTEEGKVSKVLQDRLQIAKNLFDAKKIKTILLSGRKTDNYDEPHAMKQWALENGIPENVLWIDEQGYRTINSCENAKSIHKLDQAVVITQNFHLYRALYLCDKAGVQGLGLVSDLGPYSLKNKIKWNVREMFAAWRALWDHRNQ